MRRKSGSWIRLLSVALTSPWTRVISPVVEFRYLISLTVESKHCQFSEHRKLTNIFKNDNETSRKITSSPQSITTLPSIYSQSWVFLIVFSIRPLLSQIRVPQYATILTTSCCIIRLTILQLLIDALNPDRCLSYNDIYSTVRKITAGLRANGIQPGDCVLVMSFNDVGFSHQPYVLCADCC